MQDVILKICIDPLDWHTPIAGARIESSSKRHGAMPIRAQSLSTLKRLSWLDLFYSATTAFTRFLGLSTSMPRLIANV
jgi:hypothetical protein